MFVTKIVPMIQTYFPQKNVSSVAWNKYIIKQSWKEFGKDGQVRNKGRFSGKTYFWSLGGITSDLEFSQYMICSNCQQYKTILSDNNVFEMVRDFHYFATTARWRWQWPWNSWILIAILSWIKNKTKKDRAINIINWFYL